MSYIAITHTNQTYYFRKGKPLTKRLSLGSKIQDRTLERAIEEAKEIASDSLDTEVSKTFTVKVLANDGVTLVKENEFEIQIAEETPKAETSVKVSPMTVKGIAARKRTIAKLEKFVARMNAKADRAKASMERAIARANSKVADLAVIKAELFNLENPPLETATTETVVEDATVEVEAVAAV